MNNLKKYVEWKLTHSDKTSTAEGYPLTLGNCKANKRLKQLVVYGNSIDNIGVGELIADETDVNRGKYKIPVIQRGTNLIDVNKFKNGNFKINDDGSCTLSWILTGRFSAYITNLSHIPAGSQLVFRASIIEATTNIKDLLIQLTYKNGTTKYLACWDATKITLEDTIKQVGLYIYASEQKNSYITFKNFGLYYQNEYIGFEPYVQPVTTNVFLSEPLCKIGDYVDFKNKKAVHYNDGIATEEAVKVELPVITGKTTVIEVDTQIKPSKIYAKYIKR